MNKQQQPNVLKIIQLMNSMLNNTIYGLNITWIELNKLERYGEGDNLNGPQRHKKLNYL